MSDTVDNGRFAQADFTFFTGRVGVRDREDHIEAAFFGRTPNVRVPVAGTLDGAPVQVVEIKSRALQSGAAARPGALRAVTLIIVPSQAE